MLTDFSKLALEKVKQNLGCTSVIRSGILNFNDFEYLATIAKTLVKLIFTVFKLHIHSDSKLSFDDFVIFRKFQKFAVVK